MREHMTVAAEALMTEFGAAYGCTHAPTATRSPSCCRPAAACSSVGWRSWSRSAPGSARPRSPPRRACPAISTRAWIGATAADVADYFAWRQADAARCALSTWCYWTLRQGGSTARQATAALAGASTAEQNELLYRNGINFNDVPAWQRRGLGLRWEDYPKTGHDPRTGTPATAIRRRLRIDDQLPMKDQYRAMVLAAVTTTPRP
jgi:tRNA(His) guanylyltransferase